MSIRFVPPDTVRLDIGDGDWIDVKKRLTIGELRKSQVSAIQDIRGTGTEVRYTPNAEVLGKAEVLAYLVAWSSPVKIDTPDQKKTAVDGLDPDDFDVISQAITAHVERMEAERAEAKKSRDTLTASVATLPSVAG